MAKTPDAAAASPIPWRQVLNGRTTLLLGVALLSSTTFYMVQPFFLIYFRNTQGLSTAESGLLVSVPFLAVILLGVAGGYMADRVGVVRAYTLGLMVYGVSVGAVGLVHRFVFLVLLMICAGLAMSVTSGGMQSILNLSAPPSHRSLLQNYLYWIHNVGALLGVLMASELLRAGQSNVPILILGAVRIGMFLLFLALFWGERPVASIRPETPTAPRSGPWSTVQAAMADKALRYTAFSMFLLIIMESQLDSTVPLYFTEHFRHGIALFGPIVALGTALVAVCQPLALKLLADKSSTGTFRVGALLTGIGLALGGTVGTIWAWALGMLLYSLGAVMWAIKLNDRVSALPREGHTALYFGALGTAQNAAFFIGIGLGSVFYHAAGAVVAFSSMTLIAVLVGFCFASGATGQEASKRKPLT